jgi:acyl-CoA synthetase (AMP-forming)/AMP-acid ligase II
MGFSKGDVMGVVSPNVPEFPIAVFGAAGAGMPVALVNPAYTAGMCFFINNFVALANLTQFWRVKRKSLDR